MLVMMLQVAADHYEVASQVVTSGAGLSLPEDDLTSVGVREALSQLLLTPDYQKVLKWLDVMHLYVRLRCSISISDQSRRCERGRLVQGHVRIYRELADR